MHLNIWNLSSCWWRLSVASYVKVMRRHDRCLLSAEPRWTLPAFWQIVKWKMMNSSLKFQVGRKDDAHQMRILDPILLATVRGSRYGRQEFKLYEISRYVLCSLSQGLSGRGSLPKFSLRLWGLCYDTMSRSRASRMEVSKLTRYGVSGCVSLLFESISEASKLSRNNQSDLVPCFLPSIWNPMNINLLWSWDCQLFQD